MPDPSASGRADPDWLDPIGITIAEGIQATRGLGSALVNRLGWSRNTPKVVSSTSGHIAEQAESAAGGVRAPTGDLRINQGHVVGVHAPGTGGGGAVRVFRVEGTPNTKVLISEAGQVTIVDAERALFLNFGSKARAEQYLAQKLAKGLPGVEVKSFEVPKSFVDELRAAAVPEALAGQNPGKPLIVDVTKAADQFGLKPEQIEALKKAIIQGSGKRGLD